MLGTTKQFIAITGMQLFLLRPKLTKRNLRRIKEMQLRHLKTYLNVKGQRNFANTGKISFSLSLNQFFQVFDMNFKLCFRHLVC